MHLFESLVAILLTALFLLPVARRLGVPYPTLLAAAGIAFAALPIAPDIEVDARLALALFIAPALLHAAYHSSPRGLKRYWFQLAALAVFAVLVTAAAVTLVGTTLGGLPWAAALALGAIVAPPDAAASEAVVNEVGLPRRGLLLLQGESLFNDATALLLYGLAVSLATGSEEAGSHWMLVAAAPEGVLFGLAAGWLYLRVTPLFAGTLGASLLDFAVTFGVWIVAERLHMSAVLAVVIFGMMIARHRPAFQPARDRIQTAAVWSAAVLVLNAVAFMLMGLQAREVLTRLEPAELWPAVGFSAAVLGTVLVSRIAWVFAVRAIEQAIGRVWTAEWLPKPPPWQGSLILSWSGMRGLVTLAAAFALPPNMPGRDQIVLAAFTVVIGTLLLQGTTLGPLIRWIGLEEDSSLQEKLGTARKRLIETGLDAIRGRDGAAARALRVRYGAAGEVADHGDDPQDLSAFDRLHLEVIARQREGLHAMRAAGEVPEDVYRRLQEELDWSEVDARSFEANTLRAA